MTETTISITEARQQLHEIIRKDDPFDEKAREALKLANQCLDTEQGLLVRIDQETDHWQTEITTDGADEHFSPALERDLQVTYCRRTIEDDVPHALHDAPNQGWADDPAFETSDRHTYLGVPLILGEEPYGTVCFVAEDPRSDPFSESETWFAEHLTRLLERELERESVEADLTSQTNLAAVLNRVLRHNFRNDISVVRGNIQRIAEELPDDAPIEPVFDHIDSLITLSEQARELEQIVTSDIERQPTAVGSVIEDVVETVADEQPHASLSIEYDDDISAALRPHFERAIRELLENAIKHAGDTPTVSVTIDTVPNAVEIQMTDNGPGIPDMEAEALLTGEGTPLSHGQGLGLWIVHWIVTNHGGSIDTTITDNGTTITLSIPRIPGVSPNQQLPDATRGLDRFQAAFEEAHDAILILNDDAQIVNSNTAAETLFGLEWKELVGRPLAELMPDTFDVDAEWRDLQQTGTIRGTVILDGADGEQRTVEYSGKANIVPGEHVMVGRDVTERKERERRLNAIFDQTHQFNGLLEPDGTVIEANETALNFAGVDRKDVVGKPFWETDWWQIDEATQQELQEAIDRAATGEFVRYEVEVQGKEGTALIDFSIRPITDDQGNVTELIPEGRDITEMKEREREIAALKERYETLLAAAPDPVFVADAETGEIIEVNEATETMLGKSSDELIGSHQSELHPVGQAERYQQLFEQHVQAEGTRRRLPDGSPIQVVTDDKEHVPVEISVATVSLPDGPVTYGIFRDIFETSLFRAAVESAGHSIYFTDTDGTIEYVNPAFEEMTGYTADEAIGRTPRILKSGEHDPEFYEELWDTILAGDIWRNQLVNTIRSGDRYVIDQTIAPVEGDSGEIDHFVAVNVDITERKEYEQELRRENERLDEFAGVISHDLRNPLNVAQGRATLLQQQTESDHIEAIVDSLDRMEAIIEDTLTLTRQGKLVGDREPIRCHALIENCWKMVETGEATLEITDEFSIRGDADRLQALCENLFRNAVEHGAEDVTVRIGQIDECGFYVEDDGPGIVEEDRSQVFEAGYSTAEQGTGLGLTIVKQVVEAHGWEISVTESETGGARFEITDVEFTES